MPSFLQVHAQISAADLGLRRQWRGWRTAGNDWTCIAFDKTNQRVPLTSYLQ